MYRCRRLDNCRCMLPTKFCQNQIFSVGIMDHCDFWKVVHPKWRPSKKRLLKQILSINVGFRERCSYSHFWSALLCLVMSKMDDHLPYWMRQPSWGFLFSHQNQPAVAIPVLDQKKSSSRWMSFWCSCRSWYLWPLLYEAFFYGGDFGMATCKVRTLGV